MQIVKISALWCSSCILVNKTWQQVKNNHSDIDLVELDLDFDEEIVKKYEVGTNIPVFIFIKDDKEIDRLVGEVSYEEVLNIINKE